MPDDLRWNWCNNNRKKCTINVKHLNHPETILPPTAVCGKVVFHEMGPWCHKVWDCWHRLFWMGSFYGCGTSLRQVWWDGPISRKPPSSREVLATALQAGRKMPKWPRDLVHLHFLFILDYTTEVWQRKMQGRWIETICVLWKLVYTSVI